MRFTIRIASLCLAAACLWGPSAAQAQSAATLPDGPGREVVALACTQCHQTQPFAQLRMGQEAWKKQIENMVLRGAQIGPNDIDKAALYLATSFGPGVPFPNQPNVDVKLHDGAGENLVEGACGLCHGLDRVVAANRPGHQWQAIVHRMVAIGAPLDAEQTGQIVTYLEANYASK